MAESLSEQLQDGPLKDALVRGEQFLIDREYEQALEAYLIAMQMAIDVHGTRAPVVGDICCILSGLYEESRRDHVRATKLLTFAYSITLDELGYEDMAACKILFNLGRLHKELGNSDLAEDAFYLSLGAVGDEIDGDDPVVSHMFTALGDMATARGDTTAAREYFLKAQGAVRPEDWGVKAEGAKKRAMEDRLLTYFNEI